MFKLLAEMWTTAADEHGRLIASAWLRKACLTVRRLQQDPLKRPFDLILFWGGLGTVDLNVFSSSVLLRRAFA